MNAINNLTNQPPKLVIRAVRQVLRPLAKLLLAHGVTFPAISELMKQVLVEVAQSDFPAQGRATTDSRISVLTGVHRKDVKRLRNMQQTANEAPIAISLGSKVINAWITDPRWRDAQGKPLKLARNAGDDVEFSFEDLAESVSKDVRPRAIFDELIRVHAVSLDAEDQVVLNAQAFIPEAGFEEKLFFFERAAHAHLAAATHNIEGEQPPFFERIVHYDTIPLTALPQLRELVNEYGMNALRGLNDQAKQASDAEDNDPQRITFGVYFYSQPDDGDA